MITNLAKHRGGHSNFEHVIIICFTKAKMLCWQHTFYMPLNLLSRPPIIICGPSPVSIGNCDQIQGSNKGNCKGKENYTVKLQGKENIGNCNKIKTRKHG